MSDLATRLLAAIEETERVAREAAGEKWLLPCGPSWAVLPLRVAPYHYGWDHRVAGDWDSSVVDEAHETVAAHIALHDPETVLRRCAADRKIVADYHDAARELEESAARARTTETFGGPTHAENLERRSRKQVKFATLGWVVQHLAAGYGITEEDTRG